MAKGRIHSIESMGLVDGPGIRTVVFFQGCALRCLFCHNPDSWDFSGGKEVTADEIVAKVLRFRPYFDRSGGGVTFSGGEPLMQPKFLLELLAKCRHHGIHTCLDTSGVGLGDYDEILNLCDLVLYDIKALDGADYKKMCSLGIERTLEFVEALKRIKPATIVRQVVVPGINDTDEYMRALKEYIAKELPFAQSVELLSFHKMGEHKYKKLGIAAPLAHIEAMDREKTQILWDKYFSKGE
ncbi:MAG: pyruvate formate lyase-activating protein [Clostridia bacterium]|nr:pyruvate formate lyase-activating protein [Clostridia bacterium]